MSPVLTSTYFEDFVGNFTFVPFELFVFTRVDVGRFVVVVSFTASARFFFAAAGPRGKRGVSGSHAPHPFLDHRHLLHPLSETRTSAMELSTAGADFFDFTALVFVLVVFLAARPRGKRGVSGSHLPHPPADHRHLLHPLDGTSASAVHVDVDTDVARDLVAREDARDASARFFFAAAGPRGKRGVSGSHAPHPFLCLLYTSPSPRDS